ncbi:uncharacterized protein LOC114762832 [Neltuma alba]|uniref:uncharacterized protein LOC114722625 n=1 Tax=Neltuma alba TaxID=207710 RepID=UPI0010A42536|nr:uncharacterized protein LOC114722625 [Prosopis alba]XP_028791063.1 uncharacterized protein LOC114746954 [Prosopis alba]XP_028793796.1 uncharacterized protein LOC114749468 [Prosopis alba]XP_028808258.1 uncharacterized protein LOC114762832 [Prosopis alba]
MANWNNQFTFEWMEEDEQSEEESEEDEQSQLISLLDEEITQYEEVAVLVSQYVMPYVCKEPRRTSQQTGNLWVQEILRDHEIRCYDMFRMEKEMFMRLCSKLVEHGLKNSKYLGVEEIVGMFLNTVGHGQCNRMIQERFQHSGETVSRHFHRVLQACLSLSREYIKPLDPTFSVTHPKIKNDKRYSPYFNDAIGAIDGTHVRCVVSLSKQDKYIGRKGYPTQNVMAVCDWDMCFTFVLAGWEGTAHDARVFNTAVSTPALDFPHPPPGKYYLVDAGYPTPPGYLGPYRCERYHLPDFRRQPGFENYNEVFNYYHSSLRCTIERTFGVWKNKFRILEKMPSYKYKTQVQVVCATMAIHNFLRRNSETDKDFIEAQSEGTIDEDNHDEAGETSSSNLPRSRQMNHVRDTIRDQIVLSMASN